MSSTNQSALIQAVSVASETCPHKLDGYTWAAKSQDQWCEELGFSVSTLKRLIGKPPFVREGSMVGGVKMTLLRIGEPGPVTARQTAKHMANVWRLKLNGRSATPKEFGCLVGLAETWPQGSQVEIFKAVLENWSGFMAGAKLEIYSNGEGGEERYFEYPCISFMRRFSPVGVELWELDKPNKAK